MVVVKTTAPYDMGLGTELGVAQGALKWYPGTPLQYNVVI